MRKLACSCAAFAAAVFAAHYAVPESWYIYCAAACAVLALMAVPARGKRRLSLPLILLSAAVGFACCFVQYIAVLRPAQALSGQTLRVTAVVTDFPVRYDNGSSAAEVRLAGAAPHAEARIYDYDGVLPALEPGDAIELTVKFTDAAARYGEKSDYNYSRGVFASGYAKDSCRVTGRSRLAFLYFPRYAARAVERAADGAFPADTAPFVKALLMGDKTDFYADGDAYTAMRTSGLIHVVAVSGLHVAFLVGFIMLVMGRSRRSSLICIALVWFFVVMTGASPSTVRAGFMQTLLLAAPLFGRENDPPTSLSFALAVILLASPAAAGSAALQLSFGAMAGIMAFSGPIYSRLQAAGEGRALPRLRSYAGGVLASSLGAVIFTAPILAIRFGCVPLLGPVTNILCLWAVTACFCGGFVCCGVWALLSGLGRALAWAVSWLARYIFLITGLVAKLPFACVYTANNLMSWWLCAAIAIFALTWFGRGRAKFRWVLPASLSAITLCAALIASAAVYSSGGGYITALDVGQGQSLAVMSGNSTVLIDCGGRNSPENAGDIASAYLLSRGRSRVDALILTHLHADHANGAVRLIEDMKVASVVMPQDPNDDDGMLPDILSACERHGVQVRYVGADSALTAGNIRVSLFAPPESGTANERGLSMRVSLGDTDMLVTGDMNRTAEKEIISRHDLSGTELLVAGHHGSKYSTSDELLKAAGAKTAIISVGCNFYGHPSDAALRRLQAAGAAVYRTDLNGNVTVRTDQWQNGKNRQISEP